MATSQDGPTLVGAQNENTNSIKPLKVNNAGELLVTSGGGGGGDVNLIEVGGAAIAIGQATMAASLPVVIASNQTAVPVSGTVTATNPSVGSTGAAVPASATYVGLNVGGNLTGAASGSGTAAAALRVELPTNGTGVIATVGAVTTITNPVAVTAASLPLPTGAATSANQSTQITAEQAIQAAVEIIDDWDETNRAAVNTIAGQVGVQGGAGASTALTQRIAIATDANAVSVASLPLPTGAATLAEQQTQTTALGTILTSANFASAFGTAGTADTQVMSVQGIAGMTKLLVTPDANAAVNVAQINGVTPLMGAGNTGTGSPRVTIATDQANLTTPLNVSVASKTIYQRPVYGTAQTVFNSSTDIAGGAFSAAGTDFTNNDGTIGAALYADAMIEMPDWAAAPVAGTVVQLWGLLINTDGTDDDTDAPSAAASGGARLLGSWVIAAADALQRRTITISLAGITSGFTPYVFNGTAQNMNNDGGTNMVVKITPWNLAQVG